MLSFSVRFQRSLWFLRTFSAHHFQPKKLRHEATVLVCRTSFLFYTPLASRTWPKGLHLKNPFKKAVATCRGWQVNPLPCIQRTRRNQFCRWKSFRLSFYPTKKCYHPFRVTLWWRRYSYQNRRRTHSRSLGNNRHLDAWPPSSFLLCRTLDGATQ